MKSLFDLEVLEDFSASVLERPGAKERQCLATRCELRLKACSRHDFVVSLSLSL